MTRTGPRAELEGRFSSMEAPEDVATLLDVSWKKLRFLLYRLPESRRYRRFLIKKKSGATREIDAPIEELKDLQRRLNVLLNGVYSPRLSTHGFAIQRSVITNARPHTRARYVFNLDLADFFPSIHLGRVRGMFLKKPFQCKPKVATVLAQLCCLDGRLPQGAPTSPTISNLICAKMDIELQRFAREHACVYTRYADDITFSCRLRSFPIVVAQPGSDSDRPTVGNRLREIIAGNTFAINESKLRLQASNRRQTVTGLKVNLFPNVSKKLLSQVRAMLHAWKQYGYEAAEKEFWAKFATKARAKYRPHPSYKFTLKGKIGFIGMVRGKESPIFLNLARQLKELDSDLTKGWDLDQIEEKRKGAMCVLEALVDRPGNGPIVSQGTGFFLKGFGLITCEHVLAPNLKAFVNRVPFAEHETSVVVRDANVDLAVLKTDLSLTHFLETDFKELRQGEQVILCGYPKYSKGNSEIVTCAQVTGSKRHMGHIRYLIDRPIVAGNSGGPVLDMNGKVVGIAATGTNDQTCDNPDDQFGVIPISLLKSLPLNRD